MTARRPDRASVAAILIAAVVLRVAWRVHMGSDDFFVNGYSFYYTMAEDLVSGSGRAYGWGYAMRMPLYPLFLAASLTAGRSYLWIVVPQALMGAGTVLCAYLVARNLFGGFAGILAALITAMYPYYVVHDTALQETGMVTFLTALATWLTLRASRQNKLAPFVLAGAALTLAVFVRQSLAPAAVLVAAWAGLVSGTSSTTRARLERLAAVALPMAVATVVWLGQTYLAFGSPVMTSELGWQFFNAHNPKTLAHYPAESIDRSESDALDTLSAAEQQELEALSGDDVATSDWYFRKGLDYIEAHPVETLRRAGVKLEAGFSWRFNPGRESLVQIVYLASYGPVSVLGLLGLALTWRRWRELGPIYLQFVGFVLVTAVFWAHTSHRTYLDVYLIVFAAHALIAVAGRRRSDAGR